LQCLKRGSACEYISQDETETPVQVLKRELDAFKSRSTGLEDLLRLLAAMPENEARDTLSRLRVTDDPVSILHTLKETRPGSLERSDEISDPSVLRSIQPELELEPPVGHPVSYQILDPFTTDTAVSSQNRPQIDSHEDISESIEQIALWTPPTFASSSRPSGEDGMPLRRVTESPSEVFQVDGIPSAMPEFGLDGERHLYDY